MTSRIVDRGSRSAQPKRAAKAKDNHRSRHKTRPEDKFHIVKLPFQYVKGH